MKRALREGIRHLPGEGRAIVDAYRQATLLKRKISARLKGAREGDQPDPDTVYWIDPARIVQHTNYEAKAGLPPKDRVFDAVRDKGRIHAGSWDVSSFSFEDLDVVQALRERIETGVEWEKTAFYARLSEELRRHGATGWGITSPAELDARCAYLDQLIASIREHGYQPNHTVSLPNEDKGLAGHPRYAAEIAVNIGRDGRYLFQDGRHRLAIAKALGIRSVPVKVLVRHRQWMEFRQFMLALAAGGGASSHRNELYQNPIHPDLQDIPCAHSCEDRFTAIKGVVGPGSGALLDIGANLGYFCHKFEEMGYSCFAVEHLSQCAEAAEKIRIAEGKRFTVISQDLFVAGKSAPLRDRPFEVVLALNIFHHFIKQREIFERFTAWLGELRMDTMIFEPHCSSEPQMKGAYRNFDEREFLDFIIDKTVLNHAELIHRCSDGRPIYRLWR